jgi:nucleoside-diphosphate-sugar epimerase
MRIAVTGGSGFLGRAFVGRAAAAGHAVAAIVRPTSTPLAAHPAVTTAVGTLARPPWDELARFAPDACVHAAWITEAGVYRCSPDNDRYLEESLSFVAGLVARGVAHVVALGTCAEYQPSTRPLEEAGSPVAPASPYARAKHQLHVALRERLRDAGVSFAWARIFQPYGRGEPPARLCSTVARRLADGQRVELDTPHAVRDWIHVDDVAAALLTLVERRVDAVVNVGTGVGHTVEDVALTIADVLGRRDLVAPRTSGGEEIGTFVADAERLRRLGWTPRVELGTGLAALIEGRR